ncbi:MAG: tetratricopeptide repeat protein, partial [Cyanobacteria bacterium J06607_6]
MLTLLLAGGSIGLVPIMAAPARAKLVAQVASEAALQRANELSQQALILYQQGRYDEAEPLYQQSLEIRLEQLGDRHPDVATSLNNLALLYKAQGHYDEAESLYQQSLNIYREQLGDRHP